MTQQDLSAKETSFANCTGALTTLQRPPMPTPPKRPDRNDPAVLADAAALLAPEVSRWLNDSSVGMDVIEKDLVDAMRWRDDGYDVGRAMDSNGYSVDAALVEILDDAGICKMKACSKAEEAWVDATGAQPIPIDTKVRCRSGRPSKDVGIVTANHKDGKSTVMFESMGHVRTGIGSHGYIIDWEDLTIEPS